MNETAHHRHHLKPSQLFSLFGIAVGMGWLFDYFFFGHILGINFPLYVGTLTCAYFAASRLFAFEVRKSTFWILPAILFFSIMVFVRASEMLVFINVLATFFLILLVVKNNTGTEMINLKIQDYFVTCFEMPLKFLAEMFDFFTAFFGMGKLVREHQNGYRVVRGILVSLPFLFIFGALFASADLVFNKYVSGLFTFHPDPNFAVHLFLIGVVTAFMTGAFYLLSKGIPKELPATVVPPGKESSIGIIETSVVLGVINTLFLAFILIQITYLFGGASNISEQGFTYAEYARRGFFELIAVAIFAFFLLWGSEKTIQKEHSALPKIFRLLGSFLAVQVLLVMVSSFFRLQMYENTFGFTELRFYSHSFTVWLGVLFLLFLYKINIDRRENIFALNVIASLILYVTCLNLFNPDAFIVQQNYARFLITGKLDCSYLEHLSTDAIPTLVTNFPKMEECSAPFQGFRWNYIYSDVLENRSWQSFNLSRSAAENMIYGADEHS